ncbi:MAG: outer membrane protein assembly factor BamA [Bacteroidales bacterium]|jgi:outer membrane protein insertion porin family|nr:outer membrane protein assembly factor BamA [Bacteroidales bacterium]
MTVIRRINKLILVVMLLLGGSAAAQETQEIYNYMTYNSYVIRGISITGVRFLDPNALIGISGLRNGQRISIPGDELKLAAQKLWQQGLFADVRIAITITSSDSIFLDIALQERPRISSVKYNGLKKSESQDLVEKINLPVGSQVTPYLLNTARKIIVDHFVEKGFLNTEVNYIQKDDPDQPNNVIMTVDVDKKEKVKISEIVFVGNEYFKASTLRKKMKGTKVKNINFFRASKYIDSKFEEDRLNLTTHYNDNGFKDFTILSDSLYPTVENRVGLIIRIEEGNQYFLRDIEWTGNSVYRKEDLQRVLNIKKGTVYNQSLINDRLNGTGGAQDAVSSLYQDHGYLFSRLTPVEAKVENDSVDLEIRIYEGDQAYLNDILIAGNTRTNEHVARREMFTLPGDLFSKEKIIRSIRQLGVIGHFDPEKINPTPLPDIANGTVDLLYKLEERANDQFEVSGGWGAGMFVGTVGVRFNNFAMKNFFNPKEWRPYPSGDGQSLSIRMQSNGKMYQSYSVSFTEPWLGGKRPNSLSISAYRSIMSNGEKKTASNYQSMIIDGVTVGFGKRLEWPDNFFSIYGELGYQHYDLNNYSSGYYFRFTNGTSNMLSLTTRITRFSTSPNLIYPRSGSSISLSLQITPPWSLLSGKDYSNATEQEKVKWIEFHKWVFKADYYFPLTPDDKLVLSPRVAFGYMGFFNSDIGPSPFEYFYVGGDQMSGYSFYGRETVPVRGYSDGTLTPYDKYGIRSGNVYSKITFELRYPVSLNPQATVYALTFLEAGRAWYDLKDYNPFALNRSAGVGVRANLPMFGLLGIDWAYGFDPALSGQRQDSRGHWHFVMGQQF